MIWITLIYIAFIFGNSATPAVYSAAESGWVTNLLNRVVGSIGLTALQFSEGFIRKAAHFTEYTGLGILLTLSLAKRGFFAGRRRLRLIPVGFLVACIDEGIQYFTPGRACSIKDVLLDTCGVAFGVGLLALVSYGKTRWKHHNGA